MINNLNNIFFMEQFNIFINAKTFFVVPQANLGFHVYNGDTLVLDLSAIIDHAGGYQWTNNKMYDDLTANALIKDAIESHLCKMTVS
jgi:hypothetical protein